MERLTDEQLQAIEKLLSDPTLTEAPWDWDEKMSPFYNDAEGISRGGDGTGLYEVFANVEFEDGDGGTYTDTIIIAPQLNKATAVFITEARQNIPAMLAEVRHYRTQAARLDHLIGHWLTDSEVVWEGDCLKIHRSHLETFRQQLVNPTTKEVPNNGEVDRN